MSSLSAFVYMHFDFVFLTAHPAGRLYVLIASVIVLYFSGQLSRQVVTKTAGPIFTQFSRLVDAYMRNK